MIGTTLGRYRLLAKLGEGGMGSVWRAAGPAGEVAVKVIHPRLVDSPAALARFRREAVLGASVRHPNLVATLDSGETDGGARTVFWLAMEYVEGQTLAALRDEVGRVPEDLCRHIGQEIASGLAALHAAGAVHRDVKPENVIITPDNRVRLMDLGVARSLDESARVTRTGGFVGSLAYAAPEQVSGAHVDARTDLHALGIVLYELASGVHPRADDDWRVVMRRVLHEEPRKLGAVQPQVSAWFEEVVATLVALDPARRFATAEEVRSVLAEGESSAWWAARSRALRAQTRRAPRRASVVRETALVGRDAELARLRALWTAAKSGKGGAVLVEGEAGIGKSRLVDEFVGRLAEERDDFAFLRGGYPPGGAASAFEAYAAALRDLLGADGLDDAVAELLEASPHNAPAFAALLRGDVAAQPLAREAVQSAFVQAVSALAKDRPAILLVEDLHFAPEEGRTLFAELAAAAAGTRLLVVGTSRPPVDADLVARLERHGGFARIALPRLTGRDLARLLTLALGSEHLADELSARIAEKSDGNPYFVFELLRGLREGRFLARRPDGTWISTTVIRDFEVPSSIRDIVQARVAELAPGDRALLEAAACQGFEFDALLAGETLGLARIPALKALGRLERTHRLVRAVGMRFAFDHHQVQEGLVAGLAPETRRAFHAALAEALDRRREALGTAPAEVDGPLAAQMCRHFLEGGLETSARPYAAAALTHFEKNHLNAAMVDLGRRLIAIPGFFDATARCWTMLRVARRLDILGRIDEERELWAAAIALADAEGSVQVRARVRTAFAWHLMRAGRFAEAETMAYAARDAARAGGEKQEEVLATGNLGIVLVRLGRAAEAIAHFEYVLAKGREMSNPRIEAVAAANLGDAYGAIGRMDRAEEFLERHLSLSLAQDDRRGEMSARVNLAGVHLSTGRYDEAREQCERAHRLARDTGDRDCEARAIATLGGIHEALGRFDEAGAAFERAAGMAREMGFRTGETTSTRHLAGVLLAQGRLEEARATAEKALALAQATSDREHEALASSQLAEVLAETGDKAGARLLLQRTIELARAVGDVPSEVGAAARLAALEDDESVRAARAADAERTFATHESTLTPVQRMQTRFALWRATGLRAHLDAARGVSDGILEAQSAPDRARMRREVPIHRDLARSPASRGEVPPAPEEQTEVPR